LSGIGNAYSDEILHRARLSPIALTSKLAPDEIEGLYRAAREVLTEWVERLRAQSADAFPEKVTAFREGMDTVLYPEGNKKDLADIPEDIKNRLKLVPVKHMEQVVSLALGAKFPS